MIPSYHYVAMLVTGCLHLILGVACVITAIIGFTVGSDISGLSAGVLLVGLWILLVGGLGVATGVHMIEDVKTRQLILLIRGPGVSSDWERLTADKIRQLRFAYMVTAILSACLFCLLSSGLFTGILITGADREYPTTNEDSYFTIAGFGIATSVLEFILAIVSSSICCCCSTTTHAATTILQAPLQQIVSTVSGQNTIPYQSMSNHTGEYPQPVNGTMQYETSGYAAVSSHPPAYQQHVETTKTQ